MTQPDPAVEPDHLSEAALRRGIELMFYAYRDFTADPDAILKEYQFGRAHHRAVHFIGRNPGIAVAELLGILRITKQSLARVLGELIRTGFVAQEKGTADRRRRHLHLTAKGTELEHRLSRAQQARVARAFREAGPEAVAGWRRVQLALIDPKAREAILRALDKD
jgi:DNA-binding MarR family transcriptional regulator